MSDEMIQRTEAWFAARCGRVTASRVADAVARTQKGWGAARSTYMIELIGERLTGQIASHYVTPAMQWGSDNEPFAREAYEMQTGELVSSAGFILHPAIADSGASPDGYVNEGLIEIKCPTTPTHITFLLERVVPPNHMIQMQWQMACTGRPWCDYASFDPRLPEHLRLSIGRIPRDDDMIEKLEADVRGFLTELVAKVDSLAKREKAA